MRHRVAGRRLSRTSEHRLALRRNLTAALIEHETISTTPEKAKEARRLAERLITLGKKGTLAARRRALELLPDKRVIRKLFSEIAPRYTDRQGGYTRILRLGKPRVGDAAPQVIFELVGLSEEIEERPVRPTVAEEPEKPEEPEEPREPEEIPVADEVPEEPGAEADEGQEQ